MSRRGRSGPTISLFSFQDIITSVTAIVTVITLLLALDLVQRKQAQSSDSSETIATDVAERVEAMETEIARLRSSLRTAANLAEDVAETSPAELKNEVIARRASIAELEEQRAKLENQIAEWQRRQKQQLTRQFDQQPMKEQQQTVTKTIAELEREIAEVESDDRVVYQMPRGSAKSGWIVIVDSGVIDVAPIGQRQKPVRFGSKGSGNAAGKSLLKWIEAQKLDKEYFFFLVRPEGIKEYAEINRELAKTKISRGFDLIDTEEEILDPERGASR